MDQSELLEALYSALNSPKGVVVREESGRAKLLRARLYVARKQDPDLSQIAICESPTDPEHELYLVRKADEQAAENTETLD